MLKSTFYSQGFGAIAAIVSVLGSCFTIIFFFIQRREQRRADAQSKLILDEAKIVAKRISTQFIGNFPRYLPEIKDLLLRANDSVKIMAMISSHGSFSSHDEWARLRSVIESNIAQKKRDNKKFTATLIYGARRSFTKLPRIYKDPKEWRVWKNQELEKALIEEFFRREFDLTPSDISSLSNRQYLNGRFAEHMKVCRESYVGFTRRFSNERLPMYCWIVDDREAIFAISTEDQRGRFKGAGIHTTHETLVRSLVEMFDHFNGTAEPFEKDDGRIYSGSVSDILNRPY